MAKNFRSTREFREAMLEALGTTQDKDVENEANYKSALLEALGVEHTRSDVVNFETFREKLVEGVTNYSGGSGGGGSSDFSTAVVIVEGEDEIAAPVIVFEDTPPYLSATSASGEFTVALYKGRAFCTYYGDKKVTVSGNAEVYGSGVIVTGDCTITIS